MIEGLWSFAAFIVAIGVLVAFHEYGHFWVARRLGVKVLRFSVGFGKPLWLRRGADGVEYVIAAIPLGGYVKMLDEREGAVEAADLPRAFNRQSVGRRAAIVAAGPAFNFMLAIAAYWLVFVVGVTELKPVIAAPAAGTEAARVGLQAGQVVTALNGASVRSWQELHSLVIQRALDSESLDFQLRDARGAERLASIPVQALSVEPDVLFERLGLKPFEPKIPPLLEEVVAGDPAAQAGLQAGDRLLAYDGRPIESWQQWTTWLRANPGKVTRLRIERAGAETEHELIVGRDAKSGIGRFGARVAVPPGLVDDLRVEIRRGPLEALAAATQQTWQMSVLTLKLLGRMVVGDISVRNISGPIQIAQLAGQTANLGLVSFLGFLAIISISLGVLNLLPVPVLDGGHLLYYAAEALKGAPLTERVQMVGQQIGMGLLLALMGLAFYNDIYRLIG